VPAGAELRPDRHRVLTSRFEPCARLRNVAQMGGDARRSATNDLATYRSRDSPCRGILRLSVTEIAGSVNVSSRQQQRRKHVQFRQCQAWPGPAPWNVSIRVCEETSKMTATLGSASVPQTASRFRHDRSRSISALDTTGAERVGGHARSNIQRPHRPTRVDSVLERDVAMAST
jgi:hypothetical protein